MGICVYEVRCILICAGYTRPLFSGLRCSNLTVLETIYQYMVVFRCGISVTVHTVSYITTGLYMLFEPQQTILCMGVILMSIVVCFDLSIHPLTTLVYLVPNGIVLLMLPAVYKGY